MLTTILASSNTASLDDVLNQVSSEIQTEMQSSNLFSDPSLPVSLPVCLRIIKSALENQTMLQNTMNNSNTNLSSAISSIINNTPNPLGNTVASNTQNITDLQAKTTGIIYNSTSKTTVDGVNIPSLNTTVSGLSTSMTTANNNISNLSNSINTANTNIGNLQTKTTGLAYDTTNKTTIDGTKFSDVVAGNITPITSLNTTVLGHTTSINSLNTNLGIANTNISNLQTKTTGLAYDATNKTSIDGTLFSTVNNNASTANTKTTGLAYDAINKTTIDGTKFSDVVAGNITPIISLNTTVSGHTTSINALNTKNTGILYDSTNKTTIDSVNIPSLNTTVSGHTNSINTLNTKTTGISYDSTNKTSIDGVKLSTLTNNSVNSLYKNIFQNLSYIKYTNGNNMSGLPYFINQGTNLSGVTSVKATILSEVMSISGLGVSNRFYYNGTGYYELLNAYCNIIGGTSDVTLRISTKTSDWGSQSHFIYAVFNLSNANNNIISQCYTWATSPTSFILNGVNNSNNRSILNTNGYMYVKDTYYQCFVLKVGPQDVTIIGINGMFVIMFDADSFMAFGQNFSAYMVGGAQINPFSAKPFALGFEGSPSIYTDTGNILPVAFYNTNLSISQSSSSISSNYFGSKIISFFDNTLTIKDSLASNIVNVQVKYNGNNVSSIILKDSSQTSPDLNVTF